MKIGGVGAATAVENQLSPYYGRLSFNKTVLTVDKDHNFTSKMGVLQYVKGRLLQKTIRQ